METTAMMTRLSARSGRVVQLVAWWMRRVQAGCAALAVLVAASMLLATAVSADPSPTGRTPKLLWTPERQAVWNRARAENSAWWQSLKYYADRSGTSAGRYIDIGEWPTMVYQVTGDTAYAQKAWSVLSGQFGNNGADWLREHFAEFVWMYDWLYPALSSSQRQTFINALNNWGDLCLNSDWGKRYDDSDQVTGGYFGLVFLGLATQGDNSRANEFLTKAGGLDATGTSRNNLRNTIKDYVQKSQGGIWIEGTNYNPGTLQLLIRGAEGVRTATGVDHFPEVTALLPQIALAQMQELAPNLGQSYQWGDIQDPRSMRMFRRMPLLSQLSGLLENNSAIGPYIQDLRNDLFAIVNQIDPDSKADGTDPRSFTLYNPYAPSADWHQTVASGVHYAPGSGIIFVHDGWGPSDSLFGAHMSPRLYVDHEMWYLGNFQLYRNGEWAITHPIGYDSSEGFEVNGMTFSGFSSMMEARGPVAQEFGPNGSYAYLAGTTGGSWYSPGWWNPPARFLHEWTRSLFYLPSTDKKSDTIVVFDRTNAQDPKSLQAYDGYNSTDRARIEGASALKEWTIHAPVSPNLASGSISWSTPGGQQVVVTTLLPSSQQRSVYNESQSYMPGYINDSEKRYHVRIRPGSANQWDTFLNVIQASSGSPALSNSLLRSAGGEAEGVLVRRGGHNDAVVMFGAVRGPNLPFPSMDSSFKLQWNNGLFDQLAATRLLRGSYTLSFNAGTSTTDCFLLDLDPAKSWKIKIDSGAETALTVTAQGIGRVSVSGSGTHTLTVREAGAAVSPPPSADTIPPTVSLVQPIQGITVSGQALVVATASDNVGVTGVQFKVDDANLGGLDTTNTYSAPLDSTTLSNGSHTLTAVAFDAAGNQLTSAPITIQVSNAASSPPTPGAVFYVGPTGTDDLSSGRGTTPGNPWRTINFGVANVPDNDATLMVLDGTYTNPEVSLSRAFTTRLTLKAQNPYRAILTNTGGKQLLRAFGGANYVIEGFVLGPSQSVTMIQLGEASNRFTFRNNIFRDSNNNDILKINDRTTDIVIAGNIFYNHGDSDEDIDLNAILNATVEDNIFFSDYPGSGRPISSVARSNIVVKNSPCQWDASFCNNWSKNVTIRRNVFLNWQGAPSANFIRVGEDGTPAYEAQDVLIENNLMVGNSANKIEAPIGIEASKNVTVRNNTVTGDLPARGYVVSLRASGYQTQGVTIANNVWADSAGTMNIFSLGADAGVSLVTFARNLFWNNGNSLPASADGGLEASDDAQRIMQDPKLPAIGSVVLPRYDTATGQFLSGKATIAEEFQRLVNLYGVPAAGSSVVDAADAAQAASEDILQQARTGGTGPDLGAVETTGGIVTDTTPPAITAVLVPDITASGAAITWTTNEPATSQIEYGPTSSYGNQTPVDGALLLAHSGQLSGLSENTTYYFRVRSADAAGNAAVCPTQTFQTALLPPPPPPANEAPVLAVIGDKQVTENALLTFTLSATDPESDPLTFSSSSLPSGATLTGNVFSWTPDYVQAGIVPITFTVSDGSLSASETVTITVTDTNRPPTVNAGTDQVVTLPASANLDGTLTDADLPTGGLTAGWTKVSGPGTVTFGSSTAVDTTAAFSIEGTYVLRLTANDGVVSVSDDLTVIANPAGSTFFAVLEAETMPTKTTGGPEPGGWNIWSNGYVEGTLQIPSTGEYNLQVTAKGDVALGSWPIMEVRIDGQTVATFNVSTAGWGPYAVRCALPAGSRRIAVAFTNDAYLPPEDRNLHMDKVEVSALLTPPPPPTSITLEAENMPVKTVGGPVTNGWNIWSNGYIQDTVQFPSTLLYRFQVVASGTYAGNKWPNMELRIDGKVVKSFTVNSSSWKTFTVDLTVSAASHTVAVAFTNDYYQNGQDRNLYADRVTIKPLP